MDKKKIVNYLARKVFNRDLGTGYYIMLKNEQIYPLVDYGWLFESNEISPKDAFVYIDSRRYDYRSYNYPVMYLFPLMDVFNLNEIVQSYLDKLGFYNPDYEVYPATGLKYYAVVWLFIDKLMIELTDIDTVATNIGLKEMVTDVLGKDILTQTQKEIYDDQLDEIFERLREQKLFAGYNLGEAYEILVRYYIHHDTSLTKAALAITKTYNRIFEPYRMVYDIGTGRHVII
jgi:hypothetical protein